MYAGIVYCAADLVNDDNSGDSPLFSEGSPIRAHIVKTKVIVPNGIYELDFSLTIFLHDTDHAEEVIVSHKQMKQETHDTDIGIFYDGQSFFTSNSQKIIAVTTFLKNPSSTRIASSNLTEVLREKLNEIKAPADSGALPKQLELVFKMLSDTAVRKNVDQYFVSVVPCTRGEEAA